MNANLESHPQLYANITEETKRSISRGRLNQRLAFHFTTGGRPEHLAVSVMVKAVITIIG